MGQTSVERLHGRLDVLHTSFPPSPSWIQDGCGGNDVNQDLGYFFRSLLRRWRKMATLPLPVAILDDLISGSANEVIQDGGRKRKGRHFAPPPQWGSKKVPYTTNTFYITMPKQILYRCLYHVINFCNIWLAIRLMSNQQGTLHVLERYDDMWTFNTYNWNKYTAQENGNYS